MDMYKLTNSALVYMCVGYVCVMGSFLIVKRVFR